MTPEQWDQSEDIRDMISEIIIPVGPQPFSTTPKHLQRIVREKLVLWVTACREIEAERSGDKRRYQYYNLRFLQPLMSSVYAWGFYYDITDKFAPDWKERCDLLRCVFGNIFLPKPCIKSRSHTHPVGEKWDHSYNGYSWLRWNMGVIPLKAEEMYKSKSFSQMPILGDMLEDAGCTHVRMLEHCRENKPHVRGCWVLDLILGYD